jgi:methyltransferase (TIGR00027 family)
VVAALRAIAAREPCLSLIGRDTFAEHFIKVHHKVIASLTPLPLLKASLEFLYPGCYGSVMARTCFVDTVLLDEVKKGVRQIVVIGAGYDTRSLRFKQVLKGIRIFEVDHPATQEEKTKILDDIAPWSLSSAVYVPLDLNTHPIDDALTSKGFSKNKITLFVMEGVSYYLSELVIRSILNLVGACKSGSSIVFDYSTRAFLEGDWETYGGKQVAKWLVSINEPFVFGLNENELAPFLSISKLTIVSHHGPEDLERLYLGRAGTVTGKTLGHLRLTHAYTDQDKG